MNEIIKLKSFIAVNRALTRIRDKFAPFTDKQVEVYEKSASIIGNMALCNHISHLLYLRSKVAVDILRANSVRADGEELLELYQNINNEIRFDLNL